MGVGEQRSNYGTHSITAPLLPNTLYPVCGKSRGVLRTFVGISPSLGSQVSRIGHAGDDQAGFSLIRRKIGGSSSWRPG